MSLFWGAELPIAPDSENDLGASKAKEDTVTAAGEQPTLPLSDQLSLTVLVMACIIIYGAGAVADVGVYPSVAFLLSAVLALLSAVVGLTATSDRSRQAVTLRGMLITWFIVASANALYMWLALGVEEYSPFTITIGTRLFLRSPLSVGLCCVGMWALLVPSTETRSVTSLTRLATATVVAIVIGAAGWSVPMLSMVVSWSPLAPPAIRGMFVSDVGQSLWILAVFVSGLTRGGASEGRTRRDSMRTRATVLVLVLLPLGAMTAAQMLAHPSEPLFDSRASIEEWVQKSASHLAGLALFEEGAWRLALPITLRSLFQRFGDDARTRWAVPVISSLVYALAHWPQSVWICVAAFVIGLSNYTLIWRFRSLTLAVVAHAAANVLVAPWGTVAEP